MSAAVNRPPGIDAPVRIRLLSDLPPNIEVLRAEAAGEGFRFMDRLVAEWHSGRNRFDRPGEILLGAYSGEALVAVGGLNRDPYAEEERVGRLRHLYVLRLARRQGVASAMVRQLLQQAEAAFTVVRLRTQTEDAAIFYAQHGFDPISHKTASHIIAVRRT